MSEEEVVTGDEAPSGSGHRIKINMTNEGRVLEEKGPSKGISPLSPLPPPHEGPAGGSVDGKHELNKVETAPETSSAMYVRGGVGQKTEGIYDVITFSSNPFHHML
jgi:hypothetical protein